jgi:hypothetical protein
MDVPNGPLYSSVWYRMSQYDGSPAVTAFIAVDLLAEALAVAILAALCGSVATL